MLSDLDFEELHGDTRLFLYPFRGQQVGVSRLVFAITEILQPCSKTHFWSVSDQCARVA